MKLRKQVNVPNILTLFRFLCIPVMANYILAGDEYRFIALVLYVGIWSTDLLDGFIARRFHQITDLGKLMDPFVDKVMQFTVSLTLFSIGKVPFWLPVFIAVKEVFMMVGTAVVLRTRRQVVYANWHGKLATFVFFVGSGVVIFLDTPTAAQTSSYIFLPVVALSLLAAGNYIYCGIRMFTGSSEAGDQPKGKDD